MCSGAVFVSERAKCKVIDKVFLFLICLNDILWNCLPSTTQGLQTKNPNSPQPRTGACWNESTIPVLPIPSGGGASTITSVSGPRPCWSLSTGKDSLGFFSTSQKNGGFALQQISTALFQPRNKKADKKQPCGRKMMYLFDFSWFMCDSLSYWRENRSHHRKIPRFSFCDSWYWGLFDYRDSSNDCGNECKAKVATLE